MFKILKLSIFAFSLLFSSSAIAQNVPLNVAVVDIDKVLVLATAPKGIREQVKQIRASYLQQIKGEETELRNANQALAQKQTLLSPEAFNAERRKFEQQVIEVQKKVQTRNTQLQKSQNDAQNKVKSALRDVVLEISSKKGYTLVLTRAQTVVVADPLDITNEVIALLNKKLPSVKIATK